MFFFLFCLSGSWGLVHKVFEKNTTRVREGGDFFQNPEGLTLCSQLPTAYLCEIK